MSKRKASDTSSPLNSGAAPGPASTEATLPNILAVLKNKGALTAQQLAEFEQDSHKLQRFIDIIEAIPGAKGLTTAETGMIQMMLLVNENLVGECKIKAREVLESISTIRAPQVLEWRSGSQGDWDERASLGSSDGVVENVFFSDDERVIEEAESENEEKIREVLRRHGFKIPEREAFSEFVSALCSMEMMQGFLAEDPDVIQTISETLVTKERRASLSPRVETVEEDTPTIPAAVRRILIKTNILNETECVALLQRDPTLKIRANLLQLLGQEESKITAAEEKEKIQWKQKLLKHKSEITTVEQALQWLEEGAETDNVQILAAEIPVLKASLEENTAQKDYFVKEVNALKQSKQQTSKAFQALITKTEVAWLKKHLMAGGLQEADWRLINETVNGDCHEIIVSLTEICGNDPDQVVPRLTTEPKLLRESAVTELKRRYGIVTVKRRSLYQLQEEGTSQVPGIEPEDLGSPALSYSHKPYIFEILIQQGFLTERQCGQLTVKQRKAMQAICTPYTGIFAAEMTAPEMQPTVKMMLDLDGSGLRNTISAQIQQIIRPQQVTSVAGAATRSAVPQTMVQKNPIRTASDVIAFLEWHRYVHQQYSREDIPDDEAIKDLPLPTEGLDLSENELSVLKECQASFERTAIIRLAERTRVRPLSNAPDNLKEEIQRIECAWLQQTLVATEIANQSELDSLLQEECEGEIIDVLAKACGGFENIRSQIERSKTNIGVTLILREKLQIAATYASYSSATLAAATPMLAPASSNNAFKQKLKEANIPETEVEGLTSADIEKVKSALRENGLMDSPWVWSAMWREIKRATFTPKGVPTAPSSGPRSKEYQDQLIRASQAAESGTRGFRPAAPTPETQQYLDYEYLMGIAQIPIYRDSESSPLATDYVQPLINDSEAAKEVRVLLQLVRDPKDKTSYSETVERLREEMRIPTNQLPTRDMCARTKRIAETLNQLVKSQQEETPNAVKRLIKENMLSREEWGLLKYEDRANLFVEREGAQIKELRKVAGLPPVVLGTEDFIAYRFLKIEMVGLQVLEQSDLDAMVESRQVNLTGLYAILIGKYNQLPNKQDITSAERQALQEIVKSFQNSQQQGAEQRRRTPPPPPARPRQPLTPSTVVASASIGKEYFKGTARATREQYAEAVKTGTVIAIDEARRHIEKQVETVHEGGDALLSKQARSIQALFNNPYWCVLEQHCIPEEEHHKCFHNIIVNINKAFAAAIEILETTEGEGRGGKGKSNLREFIITQLKGREPTQNKMDETIKILKENLDSKVYTDYITEHRVHILENIAPIVERLELIRSCLQKSSWTKRRDSASVTL